METKLQILYIAGLEDSKWCSHVLNSKINLVGQLLQL